MGEEGETRGGRSDEFAVGMKGFTLIELIVVVAIIVMLGVILAPQFCTVKIKVRINDEKTESPWNPSEWTPDEQTK